MLRRDGSGVYGGVWSGVLARRIPSMEKVLQIRLKEGERSQEQSVRLIYLGSQKERKKGRSHTWTWEQGGWVIKLPLGNLTTSIITLLSYTLDTTRVQHTGRPFSTTYTQVPPSHRPLSHTPRFLLHAEFLANNTVISEAVWQNRNYYLSSSNDSNNKLPL